MGFTKHNFKGAPPVCCNCGEFPNRDYNTPCFTKTDAKDTGIILRKIHGMFTELSNEVPQDVRTMIDGTQALIEKAIDLTKQHEIRIDNQIRSRIRTS